MNQRLSVSGMACGGCEETVEDALSELSGVESVRADHESDAVELTVNDTVSEDELEQAIESAGYELN